MVEINTKVDEGIEEKGLVVEDNVKTEGVIEEEDNVSDEESFIDVKDELENESSVFIIEFIEFFSIWEKVVLLLLYVYKYIVNLDLDLCI